MAKTGESGRRGWLASMAGSFVAAMAARSGDAMSASEAFQLFTFGDSILDCARYNEHGIHPGQLLVRNDDELFPEFAGRDLTSS
jgi:acyl-CoA thioesterase-1